MNRNPVLNTASWVLTTIGALNWGLVGLTGYSLVDALFGRDTVMSRVVYALVGLAGGWSAVELINAASQPSFQREVTRRFSIVR